MAAGQTAEEMANPELSDRMTPLAEESVLALYRAHQARAWMGNIVDGFEMILTQAGFQGRLDKPPAMCFLDITGYTRLTDERGDQAAAALASELSRLVQRSSVQHGGKAVKWLGDGVMFWFREPGPGVVSALDMAEGVVGAGLPPAHVGLHAGPVVMQGGDYYGQTVNIASRIAEYARPGEVLVSQAVVEACEGSIGVLHRSRCGGPQGRGRPGPPPRRPPQLGTHPRSGAARPEETSVSGHGWPNRVTPATTSGRPARERRDGRAGTRRSVTRPPPHE